jgi:uncharacterized protein
MLNLSLTAISRGGQRAQWEVPVDHPLWEGADLHLVEPVRVRVEAQPMGEDSVLVRGDIATTVESSCRRCLATVRVPVDEPIDLLFDELAATEQDELAGEVYPLPGRGDDLDLSDPLREQLVLHAPAFVLCKEECRGLCPRCGAALNRTACDCVPEPEPGPWDALKKITFD